MAEGAGKAAVAVGGVSAAAMAVALGLTTKWEGEETIPYRDIIGKWTVCNGETQVKMQTYTRGQCREFLVKAIKGPYGMGVLRCVPQLQHSVYQLGASISVAYNIGVAGFCGSTMARQFKAGDWYLACRAFEAWNKAGKVVVTGLVNRRNDEMRACFTNLPPEYTLTVKIAA